MHEGEVSLQVFMDTCKGLARHGVGKWLYRLVVIVILSGAFVVGKL